MQEKASVFKYLDGSTQNVQWEFKEQYRDEYTNDPLPEPQVHDAIKDELQYFNEHVWLGVSTADAHNDREGKALNGRWVFANKGDVAEPDVRARHVACEINTFDELRLIRRHPTLGGQTASSLTKGL